jgi:hypothetical protein
VVIGTFQLRHEYAKNPECQEDLRKALASSLKPESLARRGESHRGMRHSEDARRRAVCFTALTHR